MPSPPPATAAAGPPALPSGARHTAAVLLAAAFWGTTGVVAHFAPPGSSALAIGLATFGFGGLVLAALSWRAAAAVLREPRHRGWLAAGALGVVLYPIAYYPSMTLVGVAAGNVVALGSGPVFAALLALAVQRVRPGGRWAASTALAVAGIAMLAVGGEGAAAVTPGANDGGARLLGIALALAAGFGYALYAYAGSRLIALGAPSSAAMASLFLLGALVCLPWLAMHGLGPLAAGSGPLTIAYLALVPMALSYLLFAFGLRRLPATTATTLALAEPVVATLLAVVLIGERQDTLGWVGLGLVGVGIAVLTLPGWRSGQRRRRQR